MNKGRNRASDQEWHLIVMFWVCVIFPYESINHL
jgi:hypothetical protein